MASRNGWRRSACERLPRTRAWRWSSSLILHFQGDGTPPAAPKPQIAAASPPRPTVEPQTWSAFWNTTALGRTATDVAAELGLTTAAVRQAKSRLLRRLRRQLGDR